MASLADHAYSHCRAVIGPSPIAVDLAVTAVRRGGRSRLATLSFARAAALAEAEPAWAATLAAAFAATVPTDVPDVAEALALTRPPLERAVVDLALRHGLDRGGLGRVLGLAPAAAADRSAAVRAAWARELDPALLAWLGPGDCPELAAVLDDLDAFETVADLMAAAAPVAAHIADCQRCTDRARAMVSVPELVGKRPLEEAPVEVTLVARRNRLRPPAPAPPSIDPERRRRWPRVAVAAGVVTGLLLVGVGGAALAERSSSQDRRNHRVDALTKVAPAGVTLQLSPTVVRAGSGALLLRNTSGKAVAWHASSGATWLTLDPTSGRLAPGGVVEIISTVSPTAPEGDQRSTVTVTGDDGSAAGSVVETTVEHPPLVAATIDGCNVTATAEDEGSLGSVLLYWRDTAEHVVPMAVTPQPGRFVGTVAAGSRSWWVTAVDDRGNRALTPEQPLQNC